VEVRWRSLFRSTFLGKQCTSYNAPPTSRKHAADHWTLRNFLPLSSLFMVGKAQKSHGARSGRSTFSKPKKQIQFRSRPMRFLGFSNCEEGAPRQEISKWSTACSTFSRSGWSVVRSGSLAKGGTSKKRPSPHLHKVPTRNSKMSPRTFQTALLYSVTGARPSVHVFHLWKYSMDIHEFLYCDCNRKFVKIQFHFVHTIVNHILSPQIKFFYIFSEITYQKKHFHII
jgi:hypothetical protein